MPKRCVFLTNGRPCSRTGTGNPPLCDRHIIQIEEEIEIEEENPVLNAVLNHPGVQGLFSKLGNLIDKWGSTLDAQAQGAPRQRPAQPRPATLNPRVVLGFPPNVKLTPELVKKRRKQLAAILHPDHEGSAEAMSNLNQAAEILLKELA